MEDTEPLLHSFQTFIIGEKSLVQQVSKKIEEEDIRVLINSDKEKIIHLDLSKSISNENGEVNFIGDDIIEFRASLPQYF